MQTKLTHSQSSLPYANESDGLMPVPTDTAPNQRASQPANQSVNYSVDQSRMQARFAYQ